MTGKKSIQDHLVNKITEEKKLRDSTFETLAFFSLYDLPLSCKRIYELLPCQCSMEELETTLEVLVQDNQVFRSNNLYAIKPISWAHHQERMMEMTKKWAKIDRYFNWLALLPFVRHISVINSLSLGTADADSDIDFFVITSHNRLYFVRSVIIILFRVLGVYKTREKIKDKFCFGFFVSGSNLSLGHLMIQPKDPYFEYWLASMRPILGGQQYWEMMQKNLWLMDKFPNFQPMHRLSSAKQASFIIRLTKGLLETLLWLPGLLAEPFLRRIHISHTFKLAENRSAASTTIANSSMLKLHAHDVRAEVAVALERVLQNLI